MTILPASSEDRIKSLIYSEINKEKGLDDIGEYTRECTRRYDTERYKKLGVKAKRSFTLEEGLLQIAIEHEDAEDSKKRNFNIKALKLIRRCCHGSFTFVRNYFRMYRDMKRGFDFLYMDCKEEEQEPA